MREIKFRAWHKPTKLMLPWDWVRERLRGTSIAIHKRLNYYQGECATPPPQEVVTTYRVDNALQVFESEDFELMQYTGLKDKNGVEIYEGDILKCTHSFFQHPPGERIGEVMFLSSGWSAKFSIVCRIAPEGDNMGMGDGETGYPFEVSEVIGNIWENPELLEYCKEER